MNMQSRPPLTVAEQAMVDGFSRRIGELPGSTGVTEARDRMLEDLKAHGLPTRRIESWHYTDFRVLLKAVPDYDPAAFAETRAAFVEGSSVLPLANGVPPKLDRLAEGLTACGYADALRDGSALEGLKPRGDDDAIGRINGAFVHDGLVLSLADGMTMAQPLEIQMAHAGGQTHSRLPVTVGANVSATVIERHVNADGSPALVSCVSDLSVGPDATLTWVVLQEQGASDTHLGQINVTLAENARLLLYIVNSGGKLVRQELNVEVKGEGADFQLRGVNLLGGETHTDVTMTLDHAVPNTTSTEIVRNVVFDRARGVFQGRIRVAPGAQKTDARMASNTLLLSDDGEFSAKPELEIFADDVQCGHGATVADIDETHLFYLMSRGIPEKKARSLLVKAFVNEIVEEIEDEPLVAALHNFIEDWLDRRN